MAGILEVLRDEARQKLNPKSPNPTDARSFQAMPMKEGPETFRIVESYLERQRAVGQTSRARIYPERELGDRRGPIQELLTLDTATVEI